MAMANTMRVDLEAIYIKYTAQTMKYSKKGANPQSVKHENLNM